MARSLAWWYTSLSMDLNPRQREAVRYIDGPLLVLAGAGSGKTRVITRKIAYLIGECGLAPQHVAAVTFTNKAAREMKERVGKQLGGKNVKGLTVSTFHNLGLNILRRECKTLGYKPGFSIFDASDSAALIKELTRKEHGGDGGQDESLLWTISNWKSDLLSPEEAMEQAENPHQVAAAILYEKYQRSLKAYNALDFDDLILQPVRLFDQHPEVLERWQNRIRYLLVDEYQDTNLSQYRLVRLLVGVRGALTVVGDDDQSIYAWRGARPENLVRLREDYPELKVIKLEQNYRSSGRILHAANALIANNPHVFEKRLWSDHGPGDPIKVLVCSSEQHEAERVVSQLMGHRFRHRTRYGDYAILYRGNHQSRLFETALREARIPYHLSGGTSFFERGEVKDIMAYLRLLANPDDDNAFLRIVNTPRREIGPGTLEKLGSYATGRGVSLLAACHELGLEQVLNRRALDRVRHFAGWLVNAADNAARGDPIAVIKGLIREIDYESWLADTSRDLQQAEKRMENVTELVAWLERIAREGVEEKGIGELVARLTLMDILERDDEEEAGDRVSLMTLHAAKGLEFPYVFLVGFEEESLPHRANLEGHGLEEERRLAYVGITRAQKGLTLSYAERRKRYGEMVDLEPSRFLAELPQDDLVWEGKEGSSDPQERQQTGKAHLANLRGILDAG
ncbi:MAG: DNA helicase Rep [Gammaproteobacteria bacterium]